VKIHEVEDLLVYQKALAGIAAVSPILERVKQCGDFDLHEQLSASSGGIPGQIAEGFGQLTDRHFAHYLGIARGSAQETRGHLAASVVKTCVSTGEAANAALVYRELAAMLTALIAHLKKTDFRHRW
jgi:four helix bundle protein